MVSTKTQQEKKVTISYTAVPGSRLTDKDARTIGPILEKISKKTGGFCPADVVEAATPKNSKLHPYFEWDDVRAGQLYREYQASHLTRSIKIVIQDSGSLPETIRAFHSIRVESNDGNDNSEESVERRYMSAVQVSESEDFTVQVIEAAHAELQTWKARHDSYRRILPAFAERFKAIFEFLES